MTDAERVVWECLRGGRLAGLRFRRQQILDGFIADYYCHAARLVVEIDGSSHDGREEYDAERDATLSAKGLRVVRFTNDDVRMRLSDVLARITASCELAHRGE